jgi:hypothetical protein
MRPPRLFHKASLARMLPYRVPHPTPSTCCAKTHAARSTGLNAVCADTWRRPGRGAQRVGGRAHTQRSAAMHDDTTAASGAGVYTHDKRRHNPPAPRRWVHGPCRAVPTHLPARGEQQMSRDHANPPSTHTFPQRPVSASAIHGMELTRCTCACAGGVARVRGAPPKPERGLNSTGHAKTGKQGCGGACAQLECIRSRKSQN